MEDKLITAIKIIFLLGFLIFIHEFGHYTIAKMCKVRVNEFSIGFGPKIFSKAKNETTYEIRLIPLGGYVSLEGEDEHSDKEGSFNKASIPKRIAIIAAGAVVNIIFGLILYFIIIQIRYIIVMNSSFLEGTKYAFYALGQLIVELFKEVGYIFSGHLSIDDMTGPVGISSMISKTNGFVEFLYLLSIISISLGMTNLLPFVPLDGGKILLLIIEAIRKKELPENIVINLNMIGMFILITLSVFVTFNDVKRAI